METKPNYKVIHGPKLTMFFFDLLAVVNGIMFCCKYLHERFRKLTDGKRYSKSNKF